MKVYRDLAEKTPSFRERSETTDLIVDITLQPWRAFQPDGVILFSDILTPLPAIGIPFEIDDYKGPLLDKTIRSEEDLKMMHSMDYSKVPFIEESLKILRSEVGDTATLLGFVGAPWTLCTYIVEGQSSSTYKTIKSMAFSNPTLLKKLLSNVADCIGEYVIHQIDSGAQCVQIFDSWGGQLPPHMWEEWSKPYIQQVIAKARSKYPNVPLTLYANGNGGLLERMALLDIDCIGLDWTIDMADGRKRINSVQEKAVQGNVDPVVLFASEDAVYIWTSSLLSFYVYYIINPRLLSRPTSRQDLPPSPPLSPRLPSPSPLSPPLPPSWATPPSSFAPPRTYPETTAPSPRSQT